MEKMEWKVETEKLPTLKHGNREGYSLVEASLTLFIVSVLLLALLVFAKGAKKYSTKILNQIDNYIESQNNYVEENLEKTK